MSLDRWIRAALAIVTVASSQLAKGQTCIGDCSGDGRVAINEVITCVNIGLELLTGERCPLCDGNGDDMVAINEVIAAVNIGLGLSRPAGCDLATPLPARTGTPTFTQVPTATRTKTPTRTNTPVRDKPAQEALQPCDTLDLWKFLSTAAETYVIRADTANPATAADLALTVECNCTEEDPDPCQTDEGDNEFECTYAAPDGGCPEVPIRVRATGECFVRVGALTCQDDVIADYTLSVARFPDGKVEPLILTIDDGGPSPTPVPTPVRVLYVRADAGDDRNGGLSPQTAFQTIGVAASRVQEGDAVVVGPGTYHEGIIDPSGGSEAAPVLFLADPSGSMTTDPAGPVVIDATGMLDDQGQGVPAIRLSGAPYVTIDGFLITGAATAGIQVRLGSDQATVRNCEVFRNSGDGILVQNSANVTLFDNAVYSNTRRGAAIVGSAGARLINNTVVLNEDRGIFIGSRNDIPSPNAVLRNNIVQDNVAVNVQVTTEPQSSLEGFSSLVDLVFPPLYQPTGLPHPGDINEDALFVSSVLGNFRLTSESPARNIAVTDSLTSGEIGTLESRTTAPDGVADDDGQLDLGFHYPPGSAAPGPDAEVFYVRMTGRDTNDGLTPQAAFRSIGRAIRGAKAGDQVNVGPGSYEEGLLSPPSGRSTAPVLLRADPSGNLTGDAPGRVLVDANGDVAGFRLTAVEFVTVDGFTVTGGHQSGIQVRGGSRQVTIQNCEFLANGSDSAAADGIRVEDSREVLVFNNLIAHNQRRGIFIGGTVSGSQNTRVINNTVTQNKDRGIFIGATTAPSTGTLVQNNIVQANDGTGIQVTEGSEVGFSAAYNVVFPLTGPDAYFPRNLPRQEDINENALFVSGPGGDFYLDQTASPAVDSADPQLRADLREALTRRTTDTRGFADTGRVDRGYHFPR